MNRDMTFILLYETRLPRNHPQKHHDSIFGTVDHFSQLWCVRNHRDYSQLWTRAGPNETEADGGGNIQVRFSKALI